MKYWSFVPMLSIVAVLALWPGFTYALLTNYLQQPPPAVRPGDAQVPQGGVHLPGRDGVTNPRVLAEAKPVYTPDAMSAKIQGTVVLQCVVLPDGRVGDVRVIRSLDSKFGLDDEAVKAAKKWRFVPGMKDGVAVPVLISIEMAFALRDREDVRSLLAWPETFTAATETSAAVGNEWTDEVSEDSGIRVRFSYPQGWTFRREETGPKWFGVQDGIRLVIVDRPRPSPPIAQPLTTTQLQQIENTITGSLGRQGSTGKLQADGQVNSENRLWLWYDLWIPANDPLLPSGAMDRLQQVFDGARMWTFMTTAGSQGINVNCFVMRPRNTSEADMLAQVRQAGAQFRAMLDRMTIEAVGRK